MSRLATNRDTPLTVSEITHTALVLADREGIDALSMRRLATELRVSTMALYHHFANKAELIQSVVHEIWLEAFGLMDQRTTDPLERAVSVCVSVRQAFARHPEFALYAVASPRDSVTMDQVTAASATLLRQLGLSEADAVWAFDACTSFTLGTAIAAARRRQLDAALSQEAPTFSDPGRPGELAEVGFDDPLRHELRNITETGAIDNFERSLRALLRGILATAGVERPTDRPAS